MVRVTIEQTKHGSSFEYTQEVTGQFDDTVTAMPFLSEFMEHFEYKRIVIEPAQAEEVSDPDETK